MMASYMEPLSFVLKGLSLERIASCLEGELKTVFAAATQDGS